MKVMVWALFLLLMAFGNMSLAGSSDEINDAAGTIEKKEDITTTAALLPVYLYQKYLSSVMGGRCPMYPSCSHYTVDAVKKHGPLMGWVMACDRLMRCGRDEIKRSPLVRINQDTFCYDPVEENDFWRR